jgi:hypothetical protein
VAAGSEQEVTYNSGVHCSSAQGADGGIKLVAFKVEAAAQVIMFSYSAN